jgi:hypothetical protein
MLCPVCRHEAIGVAYPNGAIVWHHRYIPEHCLIDADESGYEHERLEPNMPFESNGEARESLPTGGRRQYRWRMHYIFKDEDSREAGQWRAKEVKSTSVERATTALVKALNAETDDGEGEWRKSDIAVLQAVCLNPPKGLDEEE